MLWLLFFRFSLFVLLFSFLFSPHENGKDDDDKTSNNAKDQDTAIVEQVEDMLGGVSTFCFHLTDK